MAEDTVHILDDLHIRVEPKERDSEIAVFVGGDKAARLMVIDLKQRIGGAVLSVGGIAGVNTEPKYRLRGYARHMLSYAVKWMTHQGYHMSGLFGIPNFYTRFGYVTALPEYELKIPVRQAEAIKASLPTRPMEVADTSRLLEIYDQTLALESGAIQRDPQKWRGFLKGPGWGRIPAVEVVTEKRVPVGYMVYDRYSDDIDIGEIAALSLEGYRSLLARAAALAAERRGQLILKVPPTHPVARLARLVGCTVKITYPKDRDGMWRVLNQDAVVATLQPVWQKRWRAAADSLTWSGVLSNRENEEGLCRVSSEKLPRSASSETVPGNKNEMERGPGRKGQVNLHLATELGSIRLEINDLHLAVTTGTESQPGDIRLNIPQTLLTQMLLGYAPLDVLAKKHSWDPRALRVLEVLFPETYSYVWWPDRF